MLGHKALKDAKRIVIKVGTSTLTHDTGHINLRRVEELVRVLADLRNSGKEVVLVSSGAVGVGIGKLGIKNADRGTKEKQAYSAIGQSELMGIYGRLFSEYGCSVAQILLTKNVLEDAVRKENAINTFGKLLDWSVIPIVNENDVISTEEIEFGDNDTLSAVVASLIGAQALIILSDIDGLYSADPRSDSSAKLVEEVNEINEELLSTAGGAGSNRGTGGMLTKLLAARRATEHGVDMVITNGDNPKIIYDILDGKRVGTLFTAKR
jgi:glutamate 5-kinase